MGEDLGKLRLFPHQNNVVEMRIMCKQMFISKRLERCADSSNRSPKALETSEYSIVGTQVTVGCFDVSPILPEDQSLYLSKNKSTNASKRRSATPVRSRVLRAQGYSTSVPCMGNIRAISAKEVGNSTPLGPGYTSHYNVKIDAFCSSRTRTP